VYGPLAFRGGGADLRDRYFERTAAGFVVRGEVRRAVTFRVGNLLDPGFLADEPPFDVVFCRNLFIYLTPDARRRAAATLDRLLAPGGVVYAGHAEPLGLIDARFRPIGPPQSFAFARVGSETATANPVPRFAPVVISIPPAGAGGKGESLAQPDPPRPVKREPEPVPSPPPASPLLALARAAADRGDPAGAIGLGERAIREGGPTADVFALLGLAHTMVGDSSAAEAAFTRALYLDPGHYDSLVHMMVLAENRGDAVAAANYRRRAARRGVNP